MNTQFTMGDKQNPNSAYLTVYKNKLDGRPVKSPVKNLKSKKGASYLKHVQRKKTRQHPRLN